MTKGRRGTGAVAKLPKLRFLVDHDAAGTADVVVDVGWRTYPANPFATDVENVARAVQHGYSYLTMDTGTSRFPLASLPFTVVLAGNAQQSTSTATAQIHELRRLIREGEIRPGPQQRIKMTAEGTTVETMTVGHKRNARRIPNGTIRKRRV